MRDDMVNCGREAHLAPGHRVYEPNHIGPDMASEVFMLEPLAGAEDPDADDRPRLVAS